MVSDQSKQDLENLDWVAPLPPLSKSMRLDIYQTSWWIRLFESIADDYGSVLRCLGRPRFRRLIRAYLKEFPPQSYTLVHAGDRLPEFLEHFEDIAIKKPWIMDLARFERADYQVYHAADSLHWNPQWLSQLTPEAASTLRLQTQSSVVLLKSKWKFEGLLKSGKTCHLGASRFVIYRDGFNSTYQTLKPLQFKLLQLAHRGSTLNEWIETAGTSQSWVGWLGEWAKRGIVYPLSAQK
ncbi:MAG: DNA-binding domain-containing protein [Bdellovibrionia bacterium]